MVADPQVGAVWLDMQPADPEVLGFEWYYDYGLRDRQIPGVEFVPYFWCSQWPRYAYGRAAVDYFELAERHLSNDYAGNLLFLNEPDRSGSDVDGGQCAMTPIEAAYFYKAVIREYPLARIVGPAPSHEDYLVDWKWLGEWYRIVSSWGLPLPSTAVIHTYLGDEPPERIVDSLFGFLAQFPGAPSRAWVTEFGSCDPAIAQKMIQAWRSDQRVVRYSWFTVRGWPSCTNLFSDQHGYPLTPVGEMWVQEHR